jgi:hypothetical protein
LAAGVSDDHIAVALEQIDQLRDSCEPWIASPGEPDDQHCLARNGSKINSAYPVGLNRSQQFRIEMRSRKSAPDTDRYGTEAWTQPHAKAPVTMPMQIEYEYNLNGNQNNVAMKKY